MSPDSDRYEKPRLAVSLLVTTLAYLFLFSLVTATRFMPALARWKAGPFLVLVGALVSLGPFTLLQLLMVRDLAAWSAHWPVRLTAALGGLVAWLTLLGLAAQMRPGTGALLAPWSNLALIGTAVLGGSLVSLAIQEAAVLLPVLLVGAIVDYWGVYFGTTHMFVQHAPHLVSQVSASVPTVAFGGVPVITTIGPGDFVFLGIFFNAIHRLGLHVNRTFWAFAALLLLSLLAVSVLPIPIPALVPMALAMVIANGRSLKLSRAELFATIYVVVFLVAVLAALSIWGPFRRVA